MSDIVRCDLCNEVHNKRETEPLRIDMYFGGNRGEDYVPNDNHSVSYHVCLLCEMKLPKTKKTVVLIEMFLAGMQNYLKDREILDDDDDTNDDLADQPNP